METTHLTNTQITLILFFIVMSAVFTAITMYTEGRKFDNRKNTQIPKHTTVHSTIRNDDNSSNKSNTHNA